MNAVQKGCCRDNEIMNLVEAYKALDTRQVAALMFRDLKAGHRKAQHRLQILHERRRLKRCRLSQDTPYVYYIERRSGRLEHLIALNWVAVWFMSRMATWDELVAWEYEQDYGMLQADAFCEVLNTFTREYNFWFVELDRTPSNPWNKAALYNQLYESEVYRNWWWVWFTNRFPGILCIAETPARAEAIVKAIKRDNVNNLRFKVLLLEDLRKEAIEGCTR